MDFKKWVKSIQTASLLTTHEKPDARKIQAPSGIDSTNNELREA